MALRLLTLIAISAASILRTDVLLASDPTIALEKLFAAGERNTPREVAAAKQQYARLQTETPNDARIGYAYAIVLIKQARYRQAIPLLESQLQANRSNLNGCRVLLHAQLLDNQRRAALQTCTKLADQVAQHELDDKSVDVESATRLLGQTFGFLESVPAASVTPEQLSNTKSDVVRRLAPAQLQSFDAAREATKKQCKQLMIAKVERDVKPDQVEEVVRTRRDEEQEKARTNDNAARISADQLREVQREYNVVAQQLMPFIRERNQLSLQIALVQGDIFNLTMSVRAQLATDAINASRTGGGRTVISRLQIDALSTTLVGLNRQALDLDRRILALQTRAGELVAAGAKASEELAESTAALAKSEKRAKNLEKQLARADRKAATKATATKAPAVTGRMAQFSTYAPFPYEQEKDRVLSWYAK